MGSAVGLSESKLNALAEHSTSGEFEAQERAALAAADEMTIGNGGLSEATFEVLRRHFDENQIVELCAVIAWENASSRFNRALGVESMGLWQTEAD